MKRILFIVIGGLVGLFISLLIFDDIKQIMSYIFSYILIGTIIFFTSKFKNGKTQH